MKSVRPKHRKASLLLISALLGIGLLAVAIWRQGAEKHRGEGSIRPVPVETAPIERGPIALKRTFSGELEALAQFVVAPKVGGRVERMLVNIADEVVKGRVVAELDNDEYVQAVAQARADLEVAKANRSEAKSAFEIAEREFKRTDSLLKRGIASDSQFDASRQELLAKKSQLQVAEAQVTKAESALQTANIRQGYTQVTAGWSGKDQRRVVAERYVDEGQTVAANTPLLLIVELDPIVGVVFVTEKDYSFLEIGQQVSLSTDAYPGKHYTGRIDRIAPIFRQSTRQARVEMHIDNPHHQLKPGMFIHATVLLQEVSEALIVPEQALTLRDERYGVFVINADGRSVSWRQVGIGIRDGERVAVTGLDVSGQVVTLGQQLVSDGSAVMIAGTHNGTIDGNRGDAP